MPLQDDVQIVSVDDHVVEPADAFEGRMPAKFADRLTLPHEHPIDRIGVYVRNGLHRRECWRTEMDWRSKDGAISRLYIFLADGMKVKFSLPTDHIMTEGWFRSRSIISISCCSACWAIRSTG